MDKRSQTALFFIILLIGGADTRADSTEAQRLAWPTAQRRMITTLLAPGANIGDLAAATAQSTPADTQDAMYKLCVLLHAGMDLEALDALRELKSVCPSVGSDTVHAIHSAAGESYQAWDVAKASLELFADDILGSWLADELFEHLLESGWTVEQVDEWLAGRSQGWQAIRVQKRLDFNIKHGRVEVLTKEFSDRARANPEDRQKVMAYLNVLSYLKYRVPGQRYDLSWLGETVKPQSATHAGDLASRLEELSEWQMAILFYRQALEIPLKDGEAMWVFRAAAIHPPIEKARPTFEATMREGLARCLLRLGCNDEAQRHVEEARRIRVKHALGRQGPLAGAAQAASGRRTIENQILREEPLFLDSPMYWLDRAAYYRGRKESKQEEEAYQKGLLVAVSHEDQPELIGVQEWRHSLLVSYLHLLRDQNREQDAIALLRKELQHVPASWASSRIAVRNLLHSEIPIDPNDGVLWGWLANRREWKSDESDLLGRILRNAPPDDLDKHLTNAEQLAKGNDPTRCLVLGSFLCSMHLPERAATLLEEAAARATAKDVRRDALARLSGAYAALGDWRRAEEVAPLYADNHSVGSLSTWYAGVALVAAKAGAKDDALRLWKRAANFSPSRVDGLDGLLKAGLKEELTALYHQMQVKMPTSKYPPRALNALE